MRALRKEAAEISPRGQIKGEWKGAAFEKEAQPRCSQGFFQYRFLSFCQTHQPKIKPAGKSKRGENWESWL